MVSTAILLIVLACLLPLPPLPEGELEGNDLGDQADPPQVVAGVSPDLER